MSEENMVTEKKVITITELKKLSEGELVELPSFVGEDRITFKLRRPSLLYMVKTGKIPNELLTDANTLFASGANGVVNRAVKDENTLKRLLEVIECICEETFVEPTYKEIKDAGIILTDSQLLAVFAYTQNGVESLKSFR